MYHNFIFKNRSHISSASHCSKLYFSPTILPALELLLDIMWGDKNKHQSSEILHAALRRAPLGTGSLRGGSLCHRAPACRCLKLMERALGNIYISNLLYRPQRCQSRASSAEGLQEDERLQHTHGHTLCGVSLERGISLWWLFYQRSCPSPGRLRPEEDDPHFLKAKCSVLISRNEQRLTWVNLLDLERFIVSCHSWTHQADLYCTHTHTHTPRYWLSDSPAHWLTTQEKNTHKTDTLTGKDKEQPHLEEKRCCIVFQEAVLLQRTNTTPTSGRRRRF